MRRVTRRIGTARVVVLIVATLLALVHGEASAHARLKGSSPAAGAHLAQVPRELRLDFSESPELGFTSLRLLDADGTEVALGQPGYPSDSRRSVVAAIAGSMRAGVYTVHWQIAGDDGHPVRGRFDFVVAPGASGVGVVPHSGRDTAGARDATRAHHDPVTLPSGNGFGAESPAYVVVRWALFVALLLTIGAASFRYLVLARVPGHADAKVVAERRAAWVGLTAAGALALALMARLLAQSYAMHGADDAFSAPLAAQMVSKTLWGKGWLLQLAGVVLSGAGFAGARRADAHAARWWRVAALGAVALAFSPAFSGHAASVPRMRALAVAADGLHVLGASSWLGTLALVLFAGLWTAGRQPAGAGAPLARDLVRAFTPVALASAALVAVTGFLATWLHVGTVPNLWRTRYGVTLLLKLGVLAVAALTGAYNWRVLTPRLGTDEATVGLRRSARVETAVAVIVLLVTAVLVATPTSLDAPT